MAHEALYVRIPLELDEKLREYLDRHREENKTSVTIKALEEYLKNVKPA